MILITLVHAVYAFSWLNALLMGLIPYTYFRKVETHIVITSLVSRLLRRRE